MQRLTLRMTACRTGLIALLVLIVGGFTCRPVTAATLDVDVFSPALPATESDIITLRAVTSDEPISGIDQTVTMNLEVNGFDIQWDLISNNSGQPGAAVQMQAGKLEDIGPLPAGSYTVTVTWAKYDFTYLGLPPQPLLDIYLQQPPTIGPRVGTYQFTVVPEPATLSVIAGGMCVLSTRRRR